jgi:hypothetical protein
MLPKGITSIPLPPIVAKEAEALALKMNVATARQLHINLGQEITMAADWLMRTAPGKFPTMDAAIAAIKAMA